MRWREYPVLPEDDAAYETLRASLDDDVARVLAYLVGRRESPAVDPDEATRLEVRVGTGLGREATIDALSTLEERDLVAVTSVARDTRGRPPKGWVAAADRDVLSSRVRSHHGLRLLERAGEVAAHFDTALPTDWLDGVDPRTRADDATALTVALNWRPNGLHAPLIAAADFDIYRTHGVAVSLNPARGSGAALDRLRDGIADVAVVGAASVCRASDEPLVPLALLHPRSMAVLYTTTERLGAPFTSVEQLRGRRLAVTPDSEVGRLARLFLAQTGVLDDVEVVSVAGDEREALERGDADVATGMPIDPHELGATGHEVSALAVADHFPVPGPALVTTAGTLLDAPDPVLRFLVGSTAGATAARRDPKRTAARVAERSGDDVESERWRIEHAHAADRETASEQGWGWQTVDAWERLEVALQQEAAG